VPATAGVPAAGFLAAVAAVGRAGGLLTVLPVEDRAAVVLVGVMNEGALAGGVFVVVNGRLGGCGLPGAAASAAGGVSPVEAMVCRLVPPSDRMLESDTER
jgi:hypothetical protein